MEDGTKIREFEDEAIIVHPESIDVKITNYCDMGCEYCHENSTIKGKHADLNKLKKKLLGANLPGGIELAIGGGNPLDHPDIYPFLKWLKSNGFIANLTVNQGHIDKFYDILVTLIEEDLVKGLGISITDSNLDCISRINKLTSNIVFHVIVGIIDPLLVRELVKFKNSKLLFLGYKTFGRGVKYYSKDVETNIDLWYRILPSFLGKAVISFDNLALSQLNVKRLFTPKGWSKFYMGDDFTFTMYIDAVKQNFAPTSRSEERFSFEDYSLLEFFNLRSEITVED